MIRDSGVLLRTDVSPPDRVQTSAIRVPRGLSVPIITCRAFSQPDWPILHRSTRNEKLIKNDGLSVSVRSLRSLFLIAVRRCRFPHVRFCQISPRCIIQVCRRCLRPQCSAKEARCTETHLAKRGVERLGIEVAHDNHTSGPTFRGQKIPQPSRRLHAIDTVIHSACRRWHPTFPVIHRNQERFGNSMQLTKHHKGPWPGELGRSLNRHNG